MLMQAALLVHPKERLDSMNLLLRMAPIALFLLVPVARTLEPSGWRALRGAAGDKGACAVLLCNAAFAFLANLLNFLITQRTSALTLQVRPATRHNLPHTSRSQHCARQIGAGSHEGRKCSTSALDQGPATHNMLL